MCNKRQHDSENVRLRHENRRLKAELEEAQEKLHARNTAKDCPSWRITFQSSEQAGQAEFSMLKQARDEIENLKKKNSEQNQEEKVVLKKTKQFGCATLCRLMDDCLPEEIETESDMQNLIDKLWPALVCEHEV